MKYKINKGDTAWDIAKVYGVSLEQLQKANPNIKDLSKINEGQELEIPIYMGTSVPSIQLWKETVIPALKHLIRTTNWRTLNINHPYEFKFDPLNPPDSDKIITIPSGTADVLKDQVKFMLQEKLRELGYKNTQEYFNKTGNDSLKLSYNADRITTTTNIPSPTLDYVNQLKTIEDYISDVTPNSELTYWDYIDPSSPVKQVISGNQSKYAKAYKMQTGKEMSRKIDPTYYRMGLYDAVVDKDGNVTITDEYDFNLTEKDRKNAAWWRKIYQDLAGTSRSFTQTLSFPVSEIE